LFWIGLIVMATCALAQDAYTLKFQPKVGDVTPYSITLEIDFSDNKVLMTNKVIEKIIKVAETGDYDVETTYLSSKIRVKNQDNETTQAPDVVTYTPVGDVLLIRGKASPAMYRTNNLIGFFIPDKPIKINDVWKHTVPADPKTGAIETTQDYKLTGVEKVGAIECLVIKVSSKEVPQTPQAEGTTGLPATCEGTMWVDPTTSIVVKKDLTLKNLPVPATIKGPVSAKLTVIRDVLTPKNPPTTDDKTTDDKATGDKK
jgi:hypothetical protein